MQGLGIQKGKGRIEPKALAVLIGGKRLIAMAVFGMALCSCYKPEAGEVWRDGHDGHLVGSFRVARASLGDGIFSNRVGGACLIASADDLQVSPRTCKLDSDCVIPKTYDVGTERGRLGPSSWQGYCDHGKGKCWYRPGSGAALCNKARQWDEGVWNFAPEKPFDDRQVAAGRRISWRVVACLNEWDFAQNEGSKDCRTGGSKRIEVLGDANLVGPHA